MIRFANFAERRSPRDPKVSETLRGVADDVQELIAKHLAILRDEVEDDVQRTLKSAIPFLIAAALIIISLVLLSASLIGLIDYLAPQFPWWISAAGIAVVFAGTAAGVLYFLKERFARFNPLPDETIEAAEESIECISKQMAENHR